MSLEQNIKDCFKGYVELADENERLRKLLWLHHGHIHLYGDDGEMQCSDCKPFLDFKRNSIEEIENMFNSESAKLLEKYHKGLLRIVQEENNKG